MLRRGPAAGSRSATGAYPGWTSNCGPGTTRELARPWGRCPAHVPVLPPRPLPSPVQQPPRVDLVRPGEAGQEVHTRGAHLHVAAGVLRVGLGSRPDLAVGLVPGDLLQAAG